VREQTIYFEAKQRNVPSLSAPSLACFEYHTPVNVGHNGSYRVRYRQLETDLLKEL
jgi:hypothetical protein